MGGGWGERDNTSHDTKKPLGRAGARVAAERIPGAQSTSQVPGSPYPWNTQLCDPAPSLQAPTCPHCIGPPATVSARGPCDQPLTAPRTLQPLDSPPQSTPMLNPLPSLLISTASPSVALGLRKDPSVPHPRLDSILGLRSAKVPGRVSQPRHHPWVEGGRFQEVRHRSQRARNLSLVPVSQEPRFAHTEPVSLAVHAHRPKGGLERSPLASPQEEEGEGGSGGGRGW